MPCLIFNEEVAGLDIFVMSGIVFESINKFK